MTRDAKLHTGRLALFSAPCLPLSGLDLPLNAYLPAYYSEHIGVAYATVGLAFMLVSLLDMAFDPFIGGFMDRTRTRYGRFKPWLLLGAPALALGVYLLFMAKPGASGWHLWLSLAIVYCGFSICQLSHVSWASLLSTDYDERSRIYTWWQGANTLGALVIVLLPVLLENALGYGHDVGVRSMGVFIIALVPLCMCLPALMIEEPAPPLHRNDAPALKDYFQALQSSATLRTVLTALSMSTATAVTAALFFVFISHAKGLSTGDASALIFFYLVAALLGAPIWAHVATRFGKHNALIVATLAYIATQALIALAIPGTFWAMAIGTFVAGLPGAASGILVRAMIADVADEDRLRTGIDSTGMLFGLVTAMNKMGNALAVGIAFISLDLLKFQPEGGGTSPIALYCLYLGLPCLIAVIGIAMLWNYPLTAAKHAEIRRLLASRDRLGLDNAPIQSNAAPPNAPHVGIAGEAMSSGG